MMSATASIGLVLLWDVDGGLTQIDKYLYSPEDYIKAGALLACGIVNTGVRNDCDPALALLSDYVDHSSPVMTIGAIFGLGLAYAGSNRDDLVELLLPVFTGMGLFLPNTIFRRRVALATTRRLSILIMSSPSPSPSPFSTF